MINVNFSTCKVPVILVRLKGNLNFLDRFSKNSGISNLRKLHPVAAELFLPDGHAD
jgi:hypothetical protein